MSILYGNKGIEKVARKVVGYYKALARYVGTGKSPYLSYSPGKERTKNFCHKLIKGYF